jgi:hypothetical protein
MFPAARFRRNRAGLRLGTMAAFIRRVREIRDVAGVTGKIAFQSFRHDGFTVAGDADLSDADVNAVGAKTETTLDIAKAPWTSDAGRAHAFAG